MEKKIQPVLWAETVLLAVLALAALFPFVYMILTSMRQTYSMELNLGLTGQLLEEFAGLQQYLGDAKGYLGILMKVVGITYLCEFSAGICKDAGFAAVSDQIEILGKLSVLFAGLPILLTVIRQIYGIL